MASGGKREGAGRPKGARQLVKVVEHFTEEEIREFFSDLKARARKDTKIALYLAEQLTGKAAQAIEMDVSGNVTISFDPAFTPKDNEGTN